MIGNKLGIKIIVINHYSILELIKTNYKYAGLSLHGTSRVEYNIQLEDNILHTFCSHKLNKHIMV